MLPAPPRPEEWSGGRTALGPRDCERLPVMLPTPPRPEECYDFHSVFERIDGDNEERLRFVELTGMTHWAFLGLDNMLSDDFSFACIGACRWRAGYRGRSNVASTSSSLARLLSGPVIANEGGGSSVLLGVGADAPGGWRICSRRAGFARSCRRRRGLRRHAMASLGS